MFFKKKWTSGIIIFSIVFSNIASTPLVAYAAQEVTDPLHMIESILGHAKTAAGLASVDGSVIAGTAATLAAIVVALGPNGASVLSSDNMNGVMDDVEQRYHINTESVQSFGENMNSSAEKGNLPQVNIFFNPTDPKNGKEITAQAMPLYFSDQKEDMYFTWYLQRKDCKLSGGNVGACDLDKDGKLTVNDWKVEAMRRIANGGFSGDQFTPGTDDDGYKARFGGNKSKSQYCYIHDFDSGIDYELTECKHLFPKSNVDETGNGKFEVPEEKFWHTDYGDPSTAQNGTKDEANVVGMGQDKFKWNYADGDKVGVVIESLSMKATKHEDASMMVMWALPKNKCVPKPTGDYVDGKEYNGGKAQIPTAEQSEGDWDKCLEDNLIDPTEGDQSGKLEIPLSFAPENPVIDSFSASSPDKMDNRGDALVVRSILVNSALKDADISYDWKVYANSAQSPTADGAWEDITEGLQSAHAISRVKGSDIPLIKINLNIDENTKVNGSNFFTRYFGANGNSVGYFQIRAKATENYDAGRKRVGRSAIVVKIVYSQTQIETREVTIENDWKLKMGTGTLCEDSVDDRTVCPVVKGQIIGVNFDAAALGFTPGNSDISWLINNKPLRCNKSISLDGGCLTGLENFFPVTGDIGEVYTVSVTANNPITGKSITLNRYFRVVDPSLLIITADSAAVWPKYLGQYVNSDGKTTDNYSQEVFQSSVGSTFKMKGLFYPNSLKKGANMSWSVNNASVAPDADGSVTVNASSSIPGSVYRVSLIGAYTPDPKIKKALADIWGISMADVVETNLSSSVEVEMKESVDGVAVGPMASSKKFLASIISYVPSSVIFFFRLIVTIGLILLVIGLTFSYVPEKRRLL